MGNIVLRHRKQEIIETPPLIKLTPEQINIIKRTWAIPNAKVKVVFVSLLRISVSYG
jgi:hypothetical protein